METAFGIGLGVGFLFLFYQTVRLQWPESYFGASDISAYSISSGPVRYLLFRFAPVFVTCLFVGVTLDRTGNAGFRGAIVTGTIHGSLTLGWALLRWACSREGLRRHRAAIAMTRGAGLVIVMLAATAAAASRDALDGMIPPISEITATLWTGVLAGVVGAFVIQTSRGHGIDEFELAEQSLQSISPELLDLADRTAFEHGADPLLVRAVMAVENLQRPKWFRALERARWKLIPRPLRRRLVPTGTYGIMQNRQPDTSQRRGVHTPCGCRAPVLRQSHERRRNP